MATAGCGRRCTTRCTQELTRIPRRQSASTRWSASACDYVVVHTDLYPPGEWAKVEERIGQVFEKWLKLAHVDGAGRVYALVPRAN